MSDAEKPPINPDAKVVEAEFELLTGSRKPENSLQKQFSLAEKLFKRQKSLVIDNFDINEFLKDTEGRNEVMRFWGDSKYSEYYRNILEDREFPSHPRLRGDFLNITLEDLDYYRKEKKLLE